MGVAGVTKSIMQITDCSLKEHRELKRERASERATERERERER